MKIFGIIIIIICFIANVLIGLFIIGLSLADKNTVANDTNKGIVATLSSETVPYKNTTIGLNFSYPKEWPISTDPQYKKDNPSLVDTFNSQDSSDGYYEGFSIFVDDINNYTFIEKIDTARNSLVANGYRIISENPLDTGSNKAQRFEVSGVQQNTNSSVVEKVKGYIYLIATEDKFIFFEFYDQEAKFDNSGKVFVKTMESLSLDR